MSAKTFFTLFLIANIYIVGCQGGLFGLIGGGIGCTIVCNAAYAGCITAGTAAAVGVTAGIATPAVVAACTAAWQPCMVGCISACAAGTGPV